MRKFLVAIAVLFLLTGFAKISGPTSGDLKWGYLLGSIGLALLGIDYLLRNAEISRELRAEQALENQELYEADKRRINKAVQSLPSANTSSREINTRTKLRTRPRAQLRLVK